jgi:hypothetical protein
VRSGRSLERESGIGTNRDAPGVTGRFFSASVILTTFDQARGEAIKTVTFGPCAGDATL